MARSSVAMLTEHPICLMQMLHHFHSLHVDDQWQDDAKELPKLAATFLDTEHCAGARGLSEAEIAKLKEIAAKAPSPTPKP